MPDTTTTEALEAPLREEIGRLREEIDRLERELSAVIRLCVRNQVGTGFPLFGDAESVRLSAGLKPSGGAK